MHRHLKSIGVLAGVLVVLAAAGCSDADGQSSTSLEDSVPSVSATAASTTTSVAASTSAASSTSTAAPPPSATSATSTLPPTDATVSTAFVPPGRDEMMAAYTEYWTVRNACFRDPAGCDRGSLERLAEGGSLEGALEVTDGYLADGVVGVPGAQETYFVFTVVAPSPDATEGFVEVCIVDGDVSVRPNDPANPADDEIVDDRVFSNTVRSEMRLVDGQWKVTSGVNLEVWEGENRCPPPGS